MQVNELQYLLGWDFAFVIKPFVQRLITPRLMKNELYSLHRKCCFVICTPMQHCESLFVYKFMLFRQWCDGSVEPHYKDNIICHIYNTLKKFVSGIMGKSCGSLLQGSRLVTASFLEKEAWISCFLTEFVFATQRNQENSGFRFSKKQLQKLVQQNVFLYRM
jgi:hypothetical protein